MGRVIAAFLFFFISNLEAQAQTGWEYLEKSPERLIGLLDLPDVVGDGCGAPGKRATVRMLTTPSGNGAFVGTIYMRDEGDAGCGLTIERAGGLKEDVPTLESGYEVVAAIVYERRGSWFRIRLKTGSAWVRRADEKEFLPYPEILHEHLAYILTPWDGRLHETPGSSDKMVALQAQWKNYFDRDVDIEYLGSRQVGNDTWMHVRLIVERCGTSLEGVMPVSGWIPAYRSNGSPATWFASRGC